MNEEARSDGESSWKVKPQIVINSMTDRTIWHIMGLS